MPRTFYALTSLALSPLMIAACQADLNDEATRVSDASVTKYSNARIFTGTRFEPGDICVSRAVIVACPQTAGVEIDLEGAYVTPPFGDAHTHHFDGTFTFEWHTSLGLETGTFYAMTMTAPGSGVARIRDQFRGADRVDVATSLGGITGPQSHPAEIYEALSLGFRSYEQQLANTDKIHASRLAADDAYYIVETEADVREKMAMLLSEQPDHIKVFLRHSDRYAEGWGKWGPGGGVDPELTPLIGELAEAAGVRTAYATSNVSDYQVALDVNAGLVTHLPCYQDTESDPDSPYFDTDTEDECLINEDQAQRASDIGMVSTLVVTEWAKTRPEKYDAWEKQNIRTLIEAGAPLAVSVDAYGSTLIPGLISGVEEGFLTAPDLLRISTMDTPRAIFPGRRVGCLAIGCEASFIGFESDPTASISAIQEISLRVKDGRRFE